MPATERVTKARLMALHPCSVGRIGVAVSTYGIRCAARHLITWQLLAVREGMRGVRIRQRGDAGSARACGRSRRGSSLCPDAVSGEARARDHGPKPGAE